MFPLSLRGTIGFRRDNEAGDVSAIADGLGQLGYSEAAEAVTTGEWSGDIGSGLRRYQSDRGLAVDGWAAPGGQTEAALNDDLSAGRKGLQAGDARNSGPRRAEHEGSDGAFVDYPPRRVEIALGESASNPAATSAEELERTSERKRFDEAL